MEQLYMLEVFIEKIRFGPSIIDIPNLEELKFGVVFAHLINLEISLDDIRGFKIDHDPFKRNLSLDLGKSTIFSCQPVELLTIISQCPLEFYLKQEYILGSASIPWGPNFYEMVDKSATNASVPPASVRDTYELLDENQVKAADLFLLIRLSSYGQNIQTDFQVVPQNNVLGDGRSGNKYFLKNVNASTVFRAQTFGDDDNDSGIPLIAAICGPADSETFLQKDKINSEDLSMNELNKVLCNNENCPGAQKFAEFGIGPAATGTGLGTLYDVTDSTDMPISYGLSNTYGRMEYYGPFGLYIRPKSIEDNDKDDDDDVGGEGDLNECNCKQKETAIINDKCQCSPLRLKGGGPENDENVRPQPMVMCKELMQSFDKVLEAYKKAIGPCGQGTCPFAYNVLDDSCKRICQGHLNSNVGMTPTQLTVASTPAVDPNSISACGTPACPFSRTQTMSTERSFQCKQLKSACGKSTCPYARQNLGTATDEDIMEMQFIDGNSKPCGSKCPHFITAPVSLKPLDPIHWDCPDPLPKGPCRNPQCPFKPKELQFIPKGPCGNTSCPYANLPPCGDTNCPFTPSQQPSAPSTPSSTCKDPKCPFSSSSSPPQNIPPCTPPPCMPPSCPPPPPCFPSSSCPPPPCQPLSCGLILPCCFNASCPSNPPTCGDPTCPLNIPPKPCPAMMTCVQQQLPLSQPCPLMQLSNASPPTPTSICSNPSCPFSSKTNDSNKCKNPDCPLNQFISDSVSICVNPDCPFKKSSIKSSICSNPVCQLMQFQTEGSICSNPQCPFAKKSSSNSKKSICSNPECPFAKRSSIKRNSVCSNPECPFQTQSLVEGKESICSNPECPFRQASLSDTKDSICSNPNCPFNQKSSLIGKTSICSNPDCPFAVGKQDTSSVCTNPDCPFNSRKNSAGKKDILPCELEVAGAKITVGYSDESSGATKFRGTMGAGQDSYNSCPCCTNITSTSVSPTSGYVNNNINTNNYNNITNDGTTAVDTTTKKKGEKHKRKSSKYMYKVGDLYPGVHIGHRECIIPGRNVPAKMGWAWNVHVPCVGLKPRRGWRPGAVGRKVAKMIMAHRKAKGLQLLGPLTSKSKKSKSRFGLEDSESDVTVAPKATLQVKKRDGAYVITMNPLKDPMKIEDNENPYMDCSPLQFKISKNKDKKDESRLCFCDDQNEPSSSSDSELDIEFTPPAGIIRPERLKKKKNVVHTDTQYIVADFAPPKPESPAGAEKPKSARKGKGGKKGKK